MKINTSSTKITKSFAPKKLKEKGFSLIELLVVTVIIGIISAIAVPNLIASRRAANEAGAIANCRSIHSAQTSHFSVHNSYALTLGRLAVNGFLDDRFGRSINDVDARLNGYRYHMYKPSDVGASNGFTSDTSTQTATRYYFHAHPTVAYPTSRLGSGSRTFFISSDQGVLYGGLGDVGIGTSNPIAEGLKPLN
ncbi:MAG: type II secretion system protein [Acidobacteria bacterium]|nr:type II secretion system protein [Acidobacteriota bacterium]